MIVFRDNTFCIAECGNKECSRKLTQQVKEEAIVFGLPVSIADMWDNCKDRKPMEGV